MISGLIPETACFNVYVSLKIMIHYSQEDLVVIEFTDQAPSIRKDSKVQAFSRELLILFYYKGLGLQILLLPSLPDSNEIAG